MTVFQANYLFKIKEETKSQNRSSVKMSTTKKQHQNKTKQNKENLEVPLSALRSFRCIYVNCFNRLRFLADVSTKLQNMHIFGQFKDHNSGRKHRN